MKTLPRISMVKLNRDFCGVECQEYDACCQLTSVLDWHWGARLRTTDSQTRANRVAFGVNLQDLNVDDVLLLQRKRKSIYYATGGLRSVAEA